MVVLPLVDAWLIGVLVVLEIESELVKCGSSSFWHAPEGPYISIAKEGIKSCITGILIFFLIWKNGSISGVPECIASELFSCLTFPSGIHELKLKLGL